MSALVYPERAGRGTLDFKHFMSQYCKMLPSTVMKSNKNSN